MPDYDYDKAAGVLVHKVSTDMKAVLKSNQELWVFYDPDSTWEAFTAPISGRVSLTG